MNNPTQTLNRDEQELLIKLYANRMEQAMHAGKRADAVTWMEAMYEAVKARNMAIWKAENIKGAK